MSANSSIFNFRYENGRRYHGYSEGHYPLPNDDVGYTHDLLQGTMVNISQKRSKWTGWTFSIIVSA